MGLRFQFAWGRSGHVCVCVCFKRVLGDEELEAPLITVLLDLHAWVCVQVGVYDSGEVSGYGCVCVCVCGGGAGRGVRGRDGGGGGGGGVGCKR